MQPILSALCLLAAVIGASAQGYAPPPPSYGAPTHDPKELQKIANAAHRAANEKIFLKERLAALNVQKQALFAKLDKIEDVILPGFEYVDAQQDGRLVAIKNRIKDLLHRLGDLEARAAGGAAVAVRNQACLPSLSTRIEELVQSNINQNAQLENIATFLEEAENKLEVKLGFTVDGSRDDINTVKEATVAFSNLVATRKCLSDFKELKIDYATGEGSAVAYYAGNHTFGGNTPTVYCGVQGFVSKLNLGQTNTYGVYPDSRQTVAFATDCQAFADRVLIKAFDTSRGKGNSVESVIVEYKACSFAAQSGFQH